MIYARPNTEETNNQSKPIKQHFQEWQKAESKSSLQSGKQWIQGLQQKSMLLEVEGNLTQYQEGFLSLPERVGLKELTKLEINQQSGK